MGTIILFAGNSAPKGWSYCDGTLLPINQNNAMFSILGTTYGGDGQTTFGLPKLKPVENSGDDKTPFQYIICVEGIYPYRN